MVIASMLPKPQRPMPADPPLFSISSPGLFLSSKAEEILHRGTLFCITSDYQRGEIHMSGKRANQELRLALTVTASNTEGMF